MTRLSLWRPQCSWSIAGSAAARCHRALLIPRDTAIAARVWLHTCWAPIPPAQPATAHHGWQTLLAACRHPAERKHAMQMVHEPSQSPYGCWDSSWPELPKLECTSMARKSIPNVTLKTVHQSKPGKPHNAVSGDKILKPARQITTGSRGEPTAAVGLGWSPWSSLSSNCQVKFNQSSPTSSAYRPEKCRAAKLPPALHIISS